MDITVYRWFTEQASRVPVGGSVVEFGSYNVNGSVRPLFTDRQYLGLDRRDGPDVDLVCDAADYVPAALVDAVVCTSLLEHCPYPERVVASALRALRPGGVFLLTTPIDDYTAHNEDGGPPRDGEHYRNPSAEELFAWLAPFHVELFEVREQQALIVASKGAL